MPDYNRHQEAELWWQAARHVGNHVTTHIGSLSSPDHVTISAGTDSRRRDAINNNLTVDDKLNVLYIGLISNFDIMVRQMIIIAIYTAASLLPELSVFDWR